MLITMKPPKPTFLSSRKCNVEQSKAGKALPAFTVDRVNGTNFYNMCLLHWGSALSPTIVNSSPERKEEMEKLHRAVDAINNEEMQENTRITVN